MGDYYIYIYGHEYENRNRPKIERSLDIGKEYQESIIQVFWPEVVLSLWTVKTSLHMQCLTMKRATTHT